MGEQVMTELSFLQPQQRLALLMLEEMLDRYPPPETGTAIEMAERAVSFVLGEQTVNIKLDLAAKQPQPTDDEIGQDKPTEANSSQSEPEDLSTGKAEKDRKTIFRPSETDQIIQADSQESIGTLCDPDAVAQLYPSERAVLVAARQISAETFCAADILNITSQNKGTVTAGLTKLVNVGLLFRPSYGRFSFVKDGVKPQEPAKPVPCKKNPFEPKPAPASETVADKPKEAKPRTGADPLSDVVKWLRGQDVDLAIVRGTYMINGRIRHTPDSLVEMANRLRSKKGLSLFTLETGE